MNYRRRKRAFQHEEAHADATEEMTPPLEREDVPSEEPRMVTSAEELAEVIDLVRAAGMCAYDTEFIGEETYHPQICLVQLATTDMIAIIDSLGEEKVYAERVRRMAYSAHFNRRKNE